MANQNRYSDKGSRRYYEKDNQRKYFDDNKRDFSYEYEEQDNNDKQKINGSEVGNGDAASWNNKSKEVKHRVARKIAAIH